jgi:hypothetical protein
LTTEQFRQVHAAQREATRPGLAPDPIDSFLLGLEITTVDDMGNSYERIHWIAEFRVWLKDEPDSQASVTLISFPFRFSAFSPGGGILMLQQLRNASKAPAR